MPWPSDTEPDDELFAVIAQEEDRQNTTLQLIASENFTSPAVLRATGSVLTNKYSEGYPGKRYYGGNQFIDEAEALAIERAQAALRRGARERPAALRRQRQHGRLPGLCCSPATPSSGCRWTTAVTSPTAPGQRQRHPVPLRLVPAEPERRAHRHGPGARPRPRAPAEDDRRRRHRVSAPHRLRAVPRHRGRGRRAAHVRHRPHRRAHRRRRPPEPVRHRRRRHAHDAQDPPRAVRRRHPVQGRAAAGGSTRPSSPACRAARSSM